MFRLVLLDGDIGDYGLQILPGVMTTGMIARLHLKTGRWVYSLRQCSQNR